MIFVLIKQGMIISNLKVSDSMLKIAFQFRKQELNLIKTSIQYLYWRDGNKEPEREQYSNSSDIKVKMILR